MARSVGTALTYPAEGNYNILPLSIIFPWFNPLQSPGLIGEGLRVWTTGTEWLMQS